MPIDTKELDLHLSYMAYSFSCDVYGSVKKSFQEWKGYLDSFEYWFKENWWNPNWEYLRDDHECDC